MAETDQPVKMSQKPTMGTPINGVVIGPRTINLVRFGKRVHLVPAKHPRRLREESQEVTHKQTKLEDTPATAVTVITRKKVIRKASQDETSYPKPAPKKPRFYPGEKARQPK